MAASARSASAAVTVGHWVLLIGGPVTLEDGGTLALYGTTGEPAQLDAASGGGTLDNDDMIFGSGTIGQGDGALTLTNETDGNILAGIGTVTGGVTTGLLTIDTGNTVTNDGVFEANGGTLIVADQVIGGGSVSISGGGTADFGSFFSENVMFSGSGTLVLSHPGSFDPGGGADGTIGGFGTNDTLDLGGYNASQGDTFTTSATFDSGTDTTLLDGDRSVSQQFGYPIHHIGR